MGSPQSRSAHSAFNQVPLNLLHEVARVGIAGVDVRAARALFRRDPHEGDAQLPDSVARGEHRRPRTAAVTGFWWRSSRRAPARRRVETRRPRSPRAQARACWTRARRRTRRCLRAPRRDTRWPRVNQGPSSSPTAQHAPCQRSEPPNSRGLTLARTARGRRRDQSGSSRHAAGEGATRSAKTRRSRGRPPRRPALPPPPARRGHPPRRRLGPLPRLREGARPHPLSGSGRGDPRDRLGQERRPQHADGLGQVARRDGDALSRDGEGGALLLHVPDQGARQREVLRPLQRLRPRQRRHDDRGRDRQPRRADHLLHGGDPRQHRPTRGEAGRHPVRGHRRVSLLRRPRSRRRVADPAPRAPAGALPPHVGDARSDRALRRGAHEAHRRSHRHGPIGRPPRPARLHLRREPPPRDDPRSREGGKGADLRRQLHPARVRRRGAEPDEHRLLHEGGEARHHRGAPRDALRQPLREGGAALREARHRHPPRGALAEVPPPRRAARAARDDEGDLRDGHARRRGQRADSHGALHEAVQVRRREDRHPDRARLPADRRARGEEGLRRAGERRRAGAGARHREPEARGQGRERPEQAAQVREEEASREGVRPLGQDDLRSPRHGDPRAARLALQRLPRDALERARARERRVQSDGAPHQREPRANVAEAGARADCDADVQVAHGRWGHRGGARSPGAREHGPPGGLLAQPRAVPVPPRDHRAPRPRDRHVRARFCSPSSRRSSRTPRWCSCASSTRSRPTGWSR